MDGTTININSASSRALYIPEIVSIVLDHLYKDWSSRRIKVNIKPSQTDPSPLACLTVNSMWEIEARRYLWRVCRSDFDSEESRRARVPDLLAITSGRQQRYANVIQELAFDDCFELGVGDHSKLAHLTFPRLRILHIGNPDPLTVIMSRHQNPPLIQYLQPLLQTLKIEGRAGSGGHFLTLTDQLFLELKMRCTRLRRLNITLRQRNKPYQSISPIKFASCIQDLMFLTNLSLGDDLSQVLTSDFLKVLARHQSLETLCSNLIPDYWIKSLTLEEQPSQLLFPKLQLLEIKISAQGFSMLLPYLKEVSILKIHTLEEKGTVCEHLKAFKGLRLDKLMAAEMGFPTNTTFDANDLVPFAQSVPNLQYLQIPTDFTEKRALSMSWNLTDAIIEELTSYLPKLIMLSMNVFNFNLSDASLFSLAKHCPLLQYCLLHASVDFQKIAEHTERAVMPELLHLNIRNSMFQLKSDKPKETAKKLKLSMPKLRGWNVPQDTKLTKALGFVPEWDDSDSDETDGE